MGESITEGTILEWKKKVGDTIQKDETLLEIATDKVDSEVPSPAEGFIVEILFEVNETVDVGVIIARIGREKGEIKSENTDKEGGVISPVEDEEKISVSPEESKPMEVAEVKSAEHKIEPLEFKGKRFYSPLVKSIAKKEGISFEELESILGSGRNNRVNKNDILNYLESRSIPKPMRMPHLPDVKPVSVVLENRVEKMGRVRQRIASHMLESVQTSPHVYSTSEVDMTAIVNIRDQHKTEYINKHGVKLTYTPFILKACVKAIQEFPLINAKIDGENIVHQQNINLGVAVALPDGNLIVPALKSSEERNFLGLARKSASLAELARNNQLQPDDIFGTTFTVTNPGMFGSLFGMAIINQPNVGILSVGAIKKRPIVKETEFGDVIAIRSMMYLTLGYDHRLIDGVYGTKFLGRICNFLENFEESEIY